VDPRTLLVAVAVADLGQDTGQRAFLENSVPVPLDSWVHRPTPTAGAFVATSALGIEAPAPPTRTLRRVELQTRFEEIATRQAVNDLGLCDPAGPGSATHPDLARMLYADGKVITPLWKAKPGDTRLDKTTGQLRPLRYDADAALHVTGSGEPAWGTKHVMVAARHEQRHARMILSVAAVPDVGGEAKTALERIGRLASLLPGAIGVIYDGAFRGTHLVELLRDRGLLPIVPVAAASGGRHARKPRTERQVLVGPGTIRDPHGTTRDCILYAEAGALCLGELTATGDVTLIPLDRTKIEPRRNADGTWRWYGLYTIPDHAGGGTLRVRLDTTDEDRRRKFNRAEHLRPIPPSDPEYRRLYARRADAESINRQLDDSQWLGRAHSVGRTRQTLNLIGYAIAVNSLALHRHRRAQAPPGELAA